jgi:hypothetical protein
MALLLATLLSIAGVAHADDNAPKKEPLAPKHFIVSEGRIEGYIGTDRVAGYGIGDSMKITLVFELTPDWLWRKQHPEAGPVKLLPPLPEPAAPAPVKGNGRKPPANVAKVQIPEMLEMPLVDVEGLKMADKTGKTTDKPSDVEVYKGADRKEYELPDGRHRVVITMVLTQFVTTQKEADGKTTKTQADAELDYTWAISRLPDSQPDLHSATTPSLTYGIHETADPNQTLLIEGDLGAKSSPVAPAAYLFTFGSLPFAIPALIALVMAAIGRATRKRALSKNQKFWKKIGEEVLVNAHEKGAFEIRHYRMIFHKLRELLGYYSISTTEALVKIEAETNIDREAGANVFHMETVLFDPERETTAADRLELFRNLVRLVPIPDKEFDQVLSLAGDLIPPRQ